MNNKQYIRFELPFLPPATAKLQAIKQILHDVYRIETTPVDTVDHDGERGLGMGLVSQGEGAHEAFIEMMLADGDDRGYDGCGVLLSCSPRGSGLVYAPYSWTDQVGTTDPQEIARRVQDLDVVSVSNAIVREWTDLGLITAVAGQAA